MFKCKIIEEHSFAAVERAVNYQMRTDEEIRRASNVHVSICTDRTGYQCTACITYEVVDPFEK